jgi:hypothetical protein
MCVRAPSLHASRCITARVRRGRCMPRQRHTITCQADDERRLKRTTGGRQPAADTTRQRCGACAQPAADPVQLPAAPHRRIDAALLGNIRPRPHRNEGAESPIYRTEAETAAVPAARRTRPHFRASGRRLRSPALAVEAHAELMLHWARIVRPMRARSFRYEGRIRTPLAGLPSLPDGRSAAALPCR